MVGELVSLRFGYSRWTNSLSASYGLKREVRDEGVEEGDETGWRARGFRKPALEGLSRASREVLAAMVALRSVGTTVGGCCFLGRMEEEANWWMKELAMADMRDMTRPEQRPMKMLMPKKTMTGYVAKEISCQ